MGSLSKLSLFLSLFLLVSTDSGQRALAFDLHNGAAIDPVHFSRYPERTAANTEMITLKDPWVDQSVSAALVEGAQHTVDLGSFAFASDEMGLPLIQRLRERMQNGVKVRTIFEKTAAKMEGDATDHAVDLLTDENLTQPAKAVYCTMLKKLLGGLALDDFYHIKVMMIDYGTINAKIVIGGRNKGNLAANFGDLAFVLRPVDPDKPWIGDDLNRMFNRDYNTLAKVYGVRKPGVPSPSALDKLKTPAPLGLKTPKHKQEFDEVMAVLEHPPLPEGAPLPDIAFRPGQMQVLANNLMEQVLKPGTGYMTHSRKKARIQNNILNGLHAEISKSKSVFFSGYALNPESGLYSDLLRVAERGGDLVFVTNGHAAMRAVTKPWTVSRGVANAAADLTLEKLGPIIEAARKSGGQVKVAILNPDKAKAVEGGYVYNHRKLIIVNQEDGASFTYVGSDNLTVSSAYKNQEVMLAVKDQRLGKFLKQQVDDEVGKFYDVVKIEDLSAMRRQPTLLRCVLKKIAEQVF